MKTNTPTTIEIENFIDTMLQMHNNAEEIRQHYRSGYCYAFALILKDAFQTGQIMWAAPYSHIVWVSNGIAYDIEGEYISEAELIPIKYLGEHIRDFKHLKSNENPITTQEINNIIQTYHNDIYNGTRD